ncbi:MAG: M61 family metallopeptidase [Deltaproteobacteria bacterium]|nr:M61 family metallopeptidase [Deltaproteobacteria bacterium]
MTTEATRAARSVITTPGGEQPIRYRVAWPEPQSHEYHVEMHVPALPDRMTTTIVFPAWAPGSYMIRDFVRHVYALKITDRQGRPLAFQRLDKQRWAITTGGAAFLVTYRVFAFETSVRTSFLDDSHAYWNGTSMFFAVEGTAGRACRVDVAAPRGATVSTALREIRPAAPKSTNSFVATSYDELVDSPFEVGTHALYKFRVGQTSFELALYGRTNADPRRLVDILRRVVRATAEIFGGFPFDRYLFIVHALPIGSGGLEHKSSVTMDITGLSFEDEKGYQRFADLAAHEFFHVWNVKRLHDPALGPFDYTKENYTRLLWFHEGFTDYLANVIILRAGITAEKEFWSWIAEDWPKYATRPGRAETPLAELSFEAWIKLYKPAENHFNKAVSYYEKGLWVGMALDLELRLSNGGKRGLPEMFRWIWDRAGRKEANVTEADVRAAAREIAGRSLDTFFDKYIHGTVELPLPALLRRAALDVEFFAPWAAESSERDPVKRARARSWAGASVQAQAHIVGSERALIKNVLPASPAADAGLTFGDEIVAVEGDRVNAASFARRLGDHPPGTTVAVSYFRRDQLRTTRLTIAVSPERWVQIEPARQPTAAALAVRRGWTGGGPDASDQAQQKGRQKRRHVRATPKRT